MSSWEGFTKPAQKQSGEFGDDERPVIREGTYHALCVRVGEPYDKANPQSGEMQTKFCAEFELTKPGRSEPVATLPTFITLPPKYLDEGFLSEKSNLYKVMKAMGYDMEGKFRVNPPEWAAEGYGCDVVVENSEPNGDRPAASWITKFLACSCDEVEDNPPPPPVKVAALPAARKQPVGAGARPRPVTEGWEGDE